jgi:predicted dehydrogenase
MIEKAKQHGVFFMEGMWTRFFPAIKKALEWVKDGSIGQPKALFVNFGIDTSDNKDAWRFKNDMAGGAMMDVGIYPLAMAFAAFGTDYRDIYSTAVIKNGVDVTNTVTLTYPDGKFAVLGSSLSLIMENKVLISGSEGGVSIGEDCSWWRPDSASLSKRKGSVMEYELKETFKQPFDTIGFQYEAKAVQDYFLAGAKQAEEMTWQDSIKISATIDKLREAWGVVYDED